ncbi:MAG: tRNA pseudouridine(38-40) synthase TruA [Bacteriovorax sp. MedPE-SWde]|nr:MAG: tRNA pseudouridine(38-40) synthase TruA [Bacteriovorax sp. MedPE-SWde]
MNYYKLTICYKGTNYYGWQIQPEPHKTSIEGELLSTIKSINKNGVSNLSGASRTDAGVHAMGQVVKVSMSLDIDSDKFKLGLNSKLPKDIRILECVKCSESYNPVKDSISKLYHYNFTVNKLENPITSDFVKNIREELDIKIMNDAAKLFIGEKDFYNFSSRSTVAKTFVREITLCEIIETKTTFPGRNIYTLKIEGSGFLKQMIRYIMGSLFAVGSGDLEVSKIAEYLSERKNDKLTPKAMAKGLCLMKIT